MSLQERTAIILDAPDVIQESDVRIFLKALKDEIEYIKIMKTNIFIVLKSDDEVDQIEMFDGTNIGEHEINIQIVGDEHESEFKEFELHYIDRKLNQEKQKELQKEMEEQEQEIHIESESESEDKNDKQQVENPENKSSENPSTEVLTPTTAKANFQRKDISVNSETYKLLSRSQQYEFNNDDLDKELSSSSNLEKVPESEQKEEQEQEQQVQEQQTQEQVQQEQVQEQEQAQEQQEQVQEQQQAQEQVQEQQQAQEQQRIQEQQEQELKAQKEKQERIQEQQEQELKAQKEEQERIRQEQLKKEQEEERLKKEQEQQQQKQKEQEQLIKQKQQQEQEKQKQKTQNNNNMQQEKLIENLKDKNSTPQEKFVYDFKMNNVSYILAFLFLIMFFFVCQLGYKVMNLERTVSDQQTLIENILASFQENNTINIANN